MERVLETQCPHCLPGSAGPLEQLRLFLCPCQENAVHFILKNGGNEEFEKELDTVSTQYTALEGI